MADSNLLEILPDDLQQRLEAADNKLAEIDERITAMSKKPIKLEISGIETISQLTAAMKGQVVTEQQLHEIILENKTATENKNAIYKEAATLIAQHNGHSKEFIAVSKGVAQVTVEEARARRDNAKAMLDEEKAAQLRSRSREKETREAEKAAAAEDKLTQKVLANELKKKEASQRYQEQLRKETEAIVAKLEKETALLQKADNAYVVLRNEYNRQSTALKGMIVEFGTADAAVVKMTADVQKMYQQLVKAEQAVGQHQRKVGQYENATFALSQIIREAPAFAYGLNVGIGSLSNNLPILFDQFKKLRVELGSSTAALRVLSASLFSFTNIFTLAYTGLMLYTSGMFKFGNAADEAAKKMRELDQTSLAHAHNEMANAETLLSIAEDENQAMNIRLRAVEDLQKKYPDYLGNLSKEAILTGQTAEAMERLNKAMINKALYEASLGKVGELANKYVQLNDELADAETKLKRLEKETVNPRLSEKEQREERGLNQANIIAAQGNVKVLRKEIADVMKEMERYQNEANAFGAKAAPLIVSPLDKTKKGRQPSSKDVTDEIESEKNRHKLQLELNQQAYENSRKTFYEQQQLNKANEDEARLHGESMLDIIEKWHSKGRITDEEYLSYSRSIQAELIKELNDAKDKGDTIRQQIIERHLKAAEAIDKEVEKLIKLRQEIEKINREIDTIQVKAALKKEYASGFSPYLQALGFDASFSQGIAGRNADIEAKRANIMELKSQAADEDSKGPGASLEKILNFDKQIANEKKSIAELEAANEDALNQKIIRGKEELAKRTVELAKTAMDAIMSIQTQAFETEARQLDQRGQNISKSYDDRVRAIQAETGYEEEKNAKIRDLNANRQAQEQKLEEEKKQLSIKRARFEKDAAIAQIILDGAAGIAKIWATYSYAPPIAAGLTAIEAAIVGAQLAKAAATPIPAYKKGTQGKAHPGGLAVVGDGGEPEYITTPTGESYWSKSEATLVDLPQGATVTPASVFETAKRNLFTVSHTQDNKERVITYELSKQNKEVIKKLDEVVDATLANRTLISIHTTDSNLSSRSSKR